jgi:hypothetical protein
MAICRFVPGNGLVYCVPLVRIRLQEKIAPYNEGKKCKIHQGLHHDILRQTEGPGKQLPRTFNHTFYLTK